MEKEVGTLIDKLNDSFLGEPWYGISLMEKLEQIDYSIANSVPGESTNSIARLVHHIINWRIFAIEKLQGNTKFNIELNGPGDWTDITIDSEKEWIELKEKLVQTQDKLIELLNGKSDDFLSRQVPGHTYDFRFLIEGIIQHDIYHLGQIGIVAKQAVS